MKILLSAYACEPNKGSEPGVGWSWAIEYAKHHQVWVLTRDNNEQTIKNYLEENPEYNNKNLHFVYVGLPKKLTFWKKGRRGMRLFYMLWQRKAAKTALKLNNKFKFDFVQHITFVSYTQPTFMYKLDIPLIWGPISGGENIPSEIKINMSGKEKLIEFIRKASQDIALITPSIRKTMKKAQLILVATEETKEKMPNCYQNKVHVLPAIGLEEIPELKNVKRDDRKVKIIMAGRLIYWKAFDIGIKAFLKIADQYPNAELHILGEGNRKLELKRLAGKYLEKQIIFNDPIPHDQIYDFYKGFDIFLNTTLRDSGCMTMMEAMSAGIPCIAISTGGPRILLNGDSIGSVTVKCYEELVDTISEKLSLLIQDERLREKTGLNQYLFAKYNFTIANKIEQLHYNIKVD